MDRPLAVPSPLHYDFLALEADLAETFLQTFDIVRESNPPLAEQALRKAMVSVANMRRLLIQPGCPRRSTRRFWIAAHGWTSPLPNDSGGDEPIVLLSRHSTKDFPECSCPARLLGSSKGHQLLATLLGASSRVS